MKNVILLVFVLSILGACQSDKKSELANLPAGIHAVAVDSVLQSSQYTYLHGKEGDKEQWLALPKMEASTGETYYYRDGLVMTDFASKELSRTFKEILFLDDISKTPAIPEKAKTANVSDSGHSSAIAGGENTQAEAPAEMRSIVADEVLQTDKYTYIRGLVGEQEIWMAVGKRDAAKGKTYYFKGGLPMTDFESKELKRKFKEILFVDNISEDPNGSGNTAAGNPHADANANKPVSSGSAIPLEKKEVKLKHDKSDVTIADLYKNKKEYAGKTIKIKGQVTKFSPGIMKRNWIHIQDGTESGGKFDLTITTDQEVKVNDNVTLEGVISIDKDFGYNYFYEVLMEDAKLVKQL